MKGCGIKGDPLQIGFALESPDLTASYVVKNAPAISFIDLDSSFGCRDCAYKKVL